MKRLRPVLENLLHHYGLWQGYQQNMVVESWPEIVGSSLAEVTKADKINEGVLRVKVKDSVWAYHLSMLKPRLIKKLNDYAGSKIVKDIFFQIDDLDREEN